MRRSEVLLFPPSEPGKGTGARTRKICYGRTGKRCFTLQAVATAWPTKGGGEVLAIDLWDGMKMEARYFADAKAGSHFSYFPASGEQRNFNLNNTAGHVLGQGIRNGGVWDGGIGWEYDTDEDEEIVRKYFKRLTGTNCTWHDPLLQWETDLMSSRRAKQYQNRMLRIESMMEQAVPEIPEGFWSWAERQIARDYVFQEKTEEGIRCKCTACHETWTQPKGIGPARRPCPKCGKEVSGTYKTEISTVPGGKRRGGKKLILMQPCMDNGMHVKKDGWPELRRRWLMRFFWIDAYWDKTGTNIIVTEGIRIFVDAGSNQGKCWYLEWVRSDGSQIWNSSNQAQWSFGKGHVYPETLEETMELWSEEQKRSGIDTLARRGHVFDANAMIIHAEEKPAWEYLIKRGLIHLALDSVNECGIYGNDASIHHKGKTPEAVLGLDPDRINRLRNMDGGQIALKWLRYEQTMGLKISQETINAYERHSYTPESVWGLLSFVRSPAKLIHYLEKQAKKEKKSVGWAVAEYGDYLDMAKKQGLNLGSDLFLFPKNLILAHDDCVAFEKEHELEIKAKETRKKFPGVEPVLREIKDKYAYESDKFRIIVPQKIEEIIHEGRTLGHCIDTTDRYFDRISQKISYLVFLRRAEEPDRPWYTLEIEPGGTVRQQRTTGNNQDKKDAEEYMPFIREWQKAVRERMTAADRELAKTAKDVRLREYKELRDKKETVWHGALAGKLLADVLEGDLIEEVG